MPELSAWGVSFSCIKNGDAKNRPINRSMIVIAGSLEQAVNLVKIYYQDPVLHNVSHHGKVGLMDYAAATDFASSRKED